MPACPECGSTEQRQKMYATVCADCYLVLSQDDRQVRLSVTLLDEPAKASPDAP